MNGTSLPPGTKIKQAMTRSELEKTVLGSVMVDQGLLISVQETITPDMFTEDRKEIAELIWELSIDSRKFDAISLSAAIKNKSVDEFIELTDYFTNNIEPVCDSLRLEYLNRKHYELYTEAENRLIAGDDVIEITNHVNNQSEILIKEGVNIVQDVEPFHNVINKFSNPEAKDTIGVRTGINKFDAETGGFKPGQYVLIGARPGMGKTTVMLYHVKHAILQGKKVAIFSLEMSAEDIISILCCLMLDLDSEKMDFFNAEERSQVIEQVNILYDSNIKIFDTAALGSTNIENIAIKTRALHQRGEVDIMFGDYIQLATTVKNTFNKNAEVTEVSRVIMRTAQATKLPFVWLSQLNRDIENRVGSKRPRVSDLRESGSLEQDAAMIVMLYRPEKYGIVEDESGNNVKGLVEWNLEKYRPAERLTHFDYALHKGRNSSNASVIQDKGIFTQDNNVVTDDSFYRSISPMAANDQDIPF